MGPEPQASDAVKVCLRSRLLFIIRMNLTTTRADPALVNAILQGQITPPPAPPRPRTPATTSLRVLARADRQPKGGDRERGCRGGGRALPTGGSIAAGFPLAHHHAGACGGGKRPPTASSRALSARAVRGRARGRPHLPPRNKAPARARGGAAWTSRRPLCHLPRGGPGSALVLRPPPPFWRRGGGSAAAARLTAPGPPARRPALARPRPGASLKRPRSSRAPRAPGAPRIPYIATAPAKNSAPRGCRGSRRAPQPRRPACTRALSARCPGPAGRAGPAEDQAPCRRRPRGPAHRRGFDRSRRRVA